MGLVCAAHQIFADLSGSPITPKNKQIFLHFIVCLTLAKEKFMEKLIFDVFEIICATFLHYGVEQLLLKIEISEHHHSKLNTPLIVLPAMTRHDKLFNYLAS